MLSIRTLARASAPRAIRMATTSTMRSARPSMFASVKPVAAAAAMTSRTFSVTARRWAAENKTESDEELSAKLESEIQIEEDMKTSEQEPASVRDFLANTPFELIDTPGKEVVKLVRQYNDEKITVSFSIADITNYDPYSQDTALEDEEAFDEQQSSSGNSKRAPDEDLAEEEEDLEDDEPSAPINLSILVEKPGKVPGALNIDATAQDGGIVVDNLFYFDDASVARAETPESAQARADIYPGPPFGSLDEDLQVLMERFLEDRGITQTLAVFVPDYVDVKEQKEYVRWLSNVKKFIDTA
ncbi:complement component 1 Q subcomponent-binding protein, mitochondrial [Geosmithia morbida]|uniref:Complement component 1 Q subcomponent-binding protein, mitochondrial n=1 Tax=Geosmithia morbida TaxID=1094350 RepID=A0A9P5D921_9HYPO|nr:complement component 1 Q subcomponent-binding protein, mitochondrial [Geosmithia morbida]KAF4126064.1 complement component 1 Q subcomponent-binding protein, mitochondrial [Geosmithia morbida]